MTPRFRTCVSDTRVGDTEDSRSQFRFASCCLVPNQMNWVLSGFSRSLFDAMHPQTNCLDGTGDPIAIMLPHPKPDGCRGAEYHLIFNIIFNIILNKNGLCVINKTCDEMR